MEIVSLLLTYAVIVLLCGALCYSLDNVEYGVFKLRMPSIYDITSDDEPSISTYKIDKYVKETILPANNYFSKLKEFEDNRNDLSIILYLWFIPELTVLLSLAIYRAYPTLSFWSLLIALPITLITLLLTQKIYKFRFSLPDFHLTFEELRVDFCEQYKRNALIIDNLSEEASLNNYCIRYHHRYLNEHIEKIRRRRYCRQLLVGFAFIIILFIEL